MALWARFSNIENIKSRYNDTFPIEVRSLCAEWIENQIINDPRDLNNDSYLVRNAAYFIRSLIEQLKENEKYINPEDPIFIVIENAICMFRTNMSNSFAIYKQICENILYEQQFFDITERLGRIRYAQLENTKKQNQYCTELQRFNSVVFYETIDAVEMRKIYHSQITQIASDLLNSYECIVTEIQNVQNTVIFERLDRWKRDQAFLANSAQLPDNTLNDIQEWFAVLAELIFTTRHSIDDIRKLNAITAIQINDMNETMERLHYRIMQQLKQLIGSGFIVEKQPPQVIKVKTRFAAAVRLLDVGMQLNDPMVTVSILSGEYFLL